jgi:hypothetical protein
MFCFIFLIISFYILNIDVNTSTKIIPNLIILSSFVILYFWISIRLNSIKEQMDAIHKNRCPACAYKINDDLSEYQVLLKKRDYESSLYTFYLSGGIISLFIIWQHLESISPFYITIPISILVITLLSLDYSLLIEKPNLNLQYAKN